MISTEIVVENKRCQTIVSFGTNEFSDFVTTQKELKHLLKLSDFEKLFVDVINGIEHPIEIKDMNLMRIINQIFNSTEDEFSTWNVERLIEFGKETVKALAMETFESGRLLELLRAKEAEVTKYFNICINQKERIRDLIYSLDTLSEKHSRFNKVHSYCQASKGLKKYGGKNPSKRKKSRQKYSERLNKESNNETDELRKKVVDYMQQSMKEIKNMLEVVTRDDLHSPFSKRQVYRIASNFIADFFMDHREGRSLTKGIIFDEVVRHIIKTFGAGKLSVPKVKDFFVSIIAHSNVPRIRLYSKFLGLDITEKKMKSGEEKLFFDAYRFIFYFDVSNGYTSDNDLQGSVQYVPYLRVHNFLEKKAKKVIRSEIIVELRQSIVREWGINEIKDDSNVCFDSFVLSLLDAFKLSSNSVIQYARVLHYLLDFNNNSEVDLEIFILFARYVDNNGITYLPIQRTKLLEKLSHYISKKSSGFKINEFSEICANFGLLRYESILKTLSIKPDDLLKEARYTIMKLNAWGSGNLHIRVRACTKMELSWCDRMHIAINKIYQYRISLLKTIIEVEAEQVGTQVAKNDIVETGADNEADKHDETRRGGEAEKASLDCNKAIFHYQCASFLMLFMVIEREVFQAEQNEEIFYVE